MPELPEVETTKAALKPYVEKQRIVKVILREHRFRWPVDPTIPQKLSGCTVTNISRRSKYLLFSLTNAIDGKDTAKQWTLVVHLGMSGSLRLVGLGSEIKRHDHIDVIFANDWIMRLHDPRRFGAFLLSPKEEIQQVISANNSTTTSVSTKLFAHLGPEPLSGVFDASYLYNQLKNKRRPIKSVIMDAKVVVGVGNIYANEVLFSSGISPLRSAIKLTIQECQLLVSSIKRILNEAIAQGGTTLKDFVSGKNQPGYFQQQLNVYGRGGQPCCSCKTILVKVKVGQRATVYCPACQL